MKLPNFNKLNERQLADLAYVISLVAIILSVFSILIATR